MCQLTSEKINYAKSNVKKDCNLIYSFGGLGALISITLFIEPNFLAGSRGGISNQYFLIAFGVCLLVLYLVRNEAICRPEKLDNILEKHQNTEDPNELCEEYFNLIGTPILISIIPNVKSIISI